MRSGNEARHLVAYTDMAPKYVAVYTDPRRFFRDLILHSHEAGDLTSFDEPTERLIGWASEMFGYRISLQTLIRKSRYVPNDDIHKAVRETTGEDFWHLIKTQEGREKLGHAWQHVKILRPRRRLGIRPREASEASA